jgi:Concanavalin A-like lectin/glucanases superfamily
MTRFGWALSGISFCFFAVAIGSTAQAVAPNPLQSAHWRFEEGTAFSRVTPRNSDVVLDSINDNDMRAFQCDACGQPGNTPIDAAPTYVNTVPPAALQSGAPNTLALDFIPNQDIYADQQEINNGIIAPGGGFTVEAAFRPNSVVAFQAIVGKEGRPALGKLGGTFPENLQTFVLKVRGDDSKLQVEQWDGGAVTSAADNPQVSSLAALQPEKWYYAAAVSTATTLSLYLRSETDPGYTLQGSIALTGGALYQGDDPNNPDWDRPWTIGRGEFGGGPADFFDGIIDEVRLSNTALSPSQFLFAPPVVGVPGDYNNNGKVDAADYVQWRNGGPLQNEVATVGTATPEDYTEWRSRFGNPPGSGSVLDGGAAVPEPSTIILGFLAVGACAARRKARAIT